MRRRRSAVAVAVVLFAFCVPATASAHGIGGRADLPLPLWLVSYAAASVLVVSFAALAWLWPRSVLEGRTPGVELRGVAVLRRPFQVVGSMLLFFVLAAALFGDPNSADNPAPRAIFVALWVGYTATGGLLGNVWAATDPLAWVRAWLGPRPKGRYRWGSWPAVALLAAFTWFELVYPDPSSPRAVAVAIGAYVVAVIAGAALWGRSWLDEGEPFGRYFAMLGHMGLLERTSRGLRLRPPLVGLASMPRRRETTALVLVALGTTTFDGLSRTRVWAGFLGDLRGWSAAVLNSFVLVWTVGAVSLVFTAACAMIPKLAGKSLQDTSAWDLADRFAHSLVPVALGYAIAHYFSLLVFEGNTLVGQLSDPFGQGWDLLGTADWTTNFTIVSSSVIAWVQVGAIVTGHVGGVILAHDRAMALVPGKRATATQYPLLAAMVVFTVGGLFLLLGG